MPSQKDRGKRKEITEQDRVSIPTFLVVFLPLTPDNFSIRNNPREEVRNAWLYSPIDA
jgi:hypothetical protein